MHELLELVAANAPEVDEFHFQLARTVIDALVVVLLAILVRAVR